MKLFFTDQENNFLQYLEELKRKPVMPYVKGALPEKVSSMLIAPRTAIDKQSLDVLHSYNIFPSRIMSHLTQWQAEGREMRPGDTIVQQVCLPPIRSLSQKIIFGVRVNEVIDEPSRKGFSYETLQGHVEKGISTFTLELHNNELFFTIHTCSTPGNLLARALGPIFSIPYQAYCTRLALKHVKEQLLAAL